MSDIAQPQLTIRAVLLSIVLAVVLAAAVRLITRVAQERVVKVTMVLPVSTILGATAVVEEEGREPLVAHRLLFLRLAPAEMD